MMGPIRLYLRYVGVSIRSQMQYRGSFVMMVIGTSASTVIDLLGIAVLFDRFGALRDWRLAEVALFFGMINVSFGLAEVFVRGFDSFARFIRGGGFDRLLLRPRSAALQVAAVEWSLGRAGRLMTGLVVGLWAAGAVGIVWTPGKLALLVAAITGGMCLFVGLFVLQATMCFWTIESLEVWSTVTDGGREAAQYPLTIYADWFRTFFTFVVPLAAVTYYPALPILGRSDEVTGTPLWFQCAAPAIGVVFLAVCSRAWRVGVRHYRSTGS